MKCSEVRNLVRLYLDSELEPKPSLEVEQHLASCPECAGLYQAEEKFDDRLFQALSRGRRTPALWEAIELKIQPARPSRRPARLWRLAFAAGAAAILLLAGLFYRHTTRKVELAFAVEECHNAYAHRITSPEFTNAVPETILRELDNRLDAAAFSYRPSAAAYKAEGGRLCHVSKVPTAVVLGHYQNTPVTIFVMKKSELVNFPNTKRRLESGEAVVCSRVGPYHFAARLVGDHVVCAMGEASMLALEALVQSIQKGA